MLQYTKTNVQGKVSFKRDIRDVRFKLKRCSLFFPICRQFELFYAYNTYFKLIYLLNNISYNLNNILPVPWNSVMFQESTEKSPILSISQVLISLTFVFNVFISENCSNIPIPLHIRPIICISWQKCTGLSWTPNFIRKLESKIFRTAGIAGISWFPRP